jgi:hypothetical protein
LKAGDINRRTKSTLLENLVLSILLYGYEIWKLTKKKEEKINIF